MSEVEGFCSVLSSLSRVDGLPLDSVLGVDGFSPSSDSELGVDELSPNSSSSDSVKSPYLFDVLSNRFWVLGSGFCR